MPPSGFDCTMVKGIKDFLLQCFQKLQEEHVGDVRGGLDLERSHIGRALASDLKLLGGNAKVTAAVLVMVDSFYEHLQELPARVLSDDGAAGLVDRLLDSSDILEGIRALHITPDGSVTKRETEQA